MSLPHHWPCSEPPFIRSPSSLAAAPSLFLCCCSPRPHRPRPPEVQTADPTGNETVQLHLAALKGRPGSTHPTPSPAGQPLAPGPSPKIPLPLFPGLARCGESTSFPTSSKAVAATRSPFPSFAESPAASLLASSLWANAELPRGGYRCRHQEAYAASSAIL